MNWEYPMILKSLIVTLSLVIATAANGATTPTGFDSKIDDLATAPLHIVQDMTADLVNDQGFTDRLFGGSRDSTITVSFNTLGQPSIFDDVSFGVGTAKDDYSLGSTAPTGAISSPFTFEESFFVKAGDELFINFALNNIKGGGYEYKVTAAPIPVPAALPLLASGIAALGLMRRRRKA